MFFTAVADVLNYFFFTYLFYPVVFTPASIKNSAGHMQNQNHLIQTFMNNI